MTNFKHPYDWSPAPFTVFKDAVLQKKIETDGYAIVDFISQEAIQELTNVYQDEHKIDDDQGGMFYSVYSQDVAYRERIHSGLERILTPSFDTHFDNFNNGLNFFINKLSGDNSAFSIHQDSSAIDEFNYSALSVWIPLQDVDENNGALWLVEKTHRMLSPFRSVSFPPPYSEIKDTVKDYLKPIRLKAGQALMFDARVIHTSGKNLSGKDRLAVVSGILPLESSFQLSYQDSPDAPIELYSQSDDFLINYPNFFHDCVLRPTIGEKIGEAPFTFPKISKTDFENSCELLDIKKANLYVEPQEEQNFITEPKHINRVLKKPQFKHSTQGNSTEVRIFKDDEMERQLCENGYVIFPFFDEEEIKNMLDYFEENHNPEGDQIYAMSHSKDVDFKTSVNSWIQETYSAHVEEHLHNVKILGGTILSKSPGGKGQIIPHRDWNLVDEDRFRSCNIWVPLVDTTAENGAIQFLPKSHLIHPTFRAVNSNHGDGDQLKHLGEFLWHNLEMRTMKAGHAFLYDHRVIHASRNNNSDKVRPAMACVVVPKESEGRLYYENETEEGRRFQEFEADSTHLLREDRFEIPSDLKLVKTLDYDTGYYDENHFDGLNLESVPKDNEPSKLSLFQKLKSKIKL